MLRKVLAGLAIAIGLGLLAIGVQIVSRRLWERRVWSCYSALTEAASVPGRQLIVPPVCQPSGIRISDLGAPGGYVLLAFRPPRTVWVSYMLGTAEYDNYAIELRSDKGVTRVKIHHGSD